MGLIKATAAAISGTLDDVWKEMFVCDSLPMETLMVRGVKRVSNRSANTGGDPNTITSGSVILVADGQCAVVVDGGKVIDSCSDPGEYVFRDPRHTPGLGGLLKETGERISFGGDALPRMQRVYYINVKECMNNPFSTQTPIRLRAAGFPLYGTVFCSGVFSYRVKDPALFYKLLAGNVAGTYSRDNLTSQITSELLTALGPAIDAVCNGSIRPSDIPAHASELCQALQEVSAKGWMGQRGLEIVSVAVSRLTPADLSDVQRMEVAAGIAYGVEPEAKERSSPAAEDPSEAAEAWTCICGAESTGAFCPMCGRPRKWTCACSQENLGRFCTRCGSERPRELTASR